MHTIKIFGLILLISLLTACASNLTGESYSRNEARQAQRVQIGTVEYVRLVVIEGTKSQIGTVAGAAVGGLAGHSVGGHGTGRNIATVLGAVAGGVLGNKAEEALTKKQGVEVTVRLPNDKLIAVVQELSETEQFHVGERVRVLRVNGNVRVSH